MGEPRKKPDPDEDPLLEALRNAPIDDEPETDEERRLVDEAWREVREGKLVPHQEARKRWLEE